MPSAAECSGVHYPTDLSLVSLTEVPRQNDSQVPDRFDADHPLVRPAGPVLKATFHSRFDLSRLAQTMWVTADAVFCNTADKLPSFTGIPSPNLAWSSLFADGRNISEIEIGSGPGKPLATDADGSITYHAYIIPFIRPETYRHWPAAQMWDLTDRPHNVPLKVTRHNLAIAPETNIVRIPEATITSASGSR